jgi:hypothetical protein
MRIRRPVARFPFKVSMKIGGIHCPDINHAAQWNPTARTKLPIVSLSRAIVCAEKYLEAGMAEQGRESLIDLLAFTSGVISEPNSTLKRTLEAIRQHLGMQIAYVSEFKNDRSVFRQVDAPGLEALIKPGDSHSLDDVYCRHILEGRLPELIPDTAAEPIAMAMPITAAAHIVSHISVPIRL